MARPAPSVCRRTRAGAPELAVRLIGNGIWLGQDGIRRGLAGPLVELGTRHFPPLLFQPRGVAEQDPPGKGHRTARLLSRVYRDHDFAASRTPDSVASKGLVTRRFSPG
jgi:hypothetical protein